MPAALGDHRDEHRRVAREQLRELRADLVEERPAGDDAVLDDFVEAGPELPAWQRRQELGIDDDRGRLMIGADQVLARGVVDADLAADRAVDLRQERRGHLDDRHAAKVGRGGEPGDVADDAAADGDDGRRAIGRGANQRIVDASDGRELLVALAIGDEDRVLRA